MKAKFLFIISIACLLLSLFSVSADILDPLTPYHPSYETSRIYLNINYNNTQITEDAYVSFFLCYNDSHTLNNFEAFNMSIFDAEKKCYWTNSYGQYDICTSANCPMLYRFPRGMNPDAKLIVFLPSLNKTFISDSFILADENSYQIRLLQNGSIEMIELWVDYVDTGISKESAFSAIIIPLVLTLLVEMMVAYAFLRLSKIKKDTKRILGFVILANIISWPLAVILFIILFLLIPDVISLLILELLVIVFEAYFLHWTNKKVLDIKKSFWLSIYMNVASIIVGFFL